MAVSVLYISYDGIMEPIGASQVWQYVKELAGEYKVFLLTYEKPEDLRDRKRYSAMRDKAKAANVLWVALAYHKTPPILATLYDVTTGIFVSFYLCLVRKIQVVHARSYIASCVALVLKLILRKKFIFDMRGFWADERLEIGQINRRSSTYRVFKWLEKMFLLNADCVVSLTLRGAEEIKKFPFMKGKNTRLAVIPTCVDLDLFKPDFPGTTRDKNVFTVAIVGNVRGLYLFDEMLDFFKILAGKLPSAKLLFLNRGEHTFLREKLKAHDIPLQSAAIKEVEHSRVGREIVHADAGLFFIKPTFSKIASMPTKLGEFLACGIPCVTNRGIGDTESIIEGSKIGVVLKGFEKQQKENAVKELFAIMQDKELKNRCRKKAEEYFSLKKGVSSYKDIYRQLL